MARYKYNPAFLSNDELIASFVVRKEDFELILRVVRENDGDANQHVLVVGPRGIGKTMLVRRVTAEVQRDPELSRTWYPVPFAEESYQVGTPGELWLEALLHLARTADDVTLRRAYEDLRNDNDEVRLRERALAALLDYANQIKKRLLLVVENLHMLLDEQMGSDDAWTLRHTLLNEPRLMLLATATTRAQSMEGPDQAFYELFREHRLRALDTDQCRTLWRAIVGADPGERRLRPIQILTGGNPRLIGIVAGFATGLSLRELMSDLNHLIDEHTEYFKGHLEALPATERRVYLALAELWDPKTAREVAAAARSDVNGASALLARLESRGLILVDTTRPRRKLYQVAERMYNIYYLLRRQGPPESRVRALVDFMSSFYEPEELPRVAENIATEACRLSPADRRDHFLLYGQLFKCCGPEEVRERLLARTPEEFLCASDAPDDVRSLVRPLQTTLDRKALIGLLSAIEAGYTGDRPPKGLRGKSGNLSSWLAGSLGGKGHAEELLLNVTQSDPNELAGHILLSVLYSGWSDRREAEELSMRRAVQIEPRSALAWKWLGRFLHHTDQFQEAVDAYRMALELSRDDVASWRELAQILRAHMNDREGAEAALRLGLGVQLEDRGLLGDLSMILARTGRGTEALQTIESHASSLGPHIRWNQTGIVYEILGDLENSEVAYRRSLEAHERCPGGWFDFGRVVERQGRLEDAVEAYKRSLSLYSNNPRRTVVLIRVLLGLQRGSEALGVARDLLARRTNDFRFRNELAWIFYLHADDASLEFAEAWARDAVRAKPKNGEFRRTLASILARRHLGKEALEHLEAYLSAPAPSKNSADETSNLIAELAARGFAREAADVITRSPCASHLEPLLVGLRLFLGEEVQVAVEFREVGEDVRRRIEELQKKLSVEEASLETAGEKDAVNSSSIDLSTGSRLPRPRRRRKHDA